jgi:DNA ligase (NAD+)
MDIRGLGERTCQLLLEAGLVRDVGDLYGVTVEALLALDGFQQKSAENLVAGIQDTRSRGLARVLFALGVRHVGETAAQLLARAFGSWERLMGASVEVLAAVHGIGRTTAEALASYLAEPANVAVIEKLRAAGVDLTEPEARPAEGPLSGMCFVVTGTLPTLSRKQATQAIEEAGGRVTGSVTRTTDVLVVGEDAGSKLARARELGITLWSEEDLLRHLGRAASGSPTPSDAAHD